MNEMRTGYEGKSERRTACVADSALSGAENCAAAIMQQMGLDVEVAPGRREALDALRAGSYAAVIVEDSWPRVIHVARRCCGR